jgi:hypothetical protein
MIRVLSDEQSAVLQSLGCKPLPYITWQHALVFAAEATEEQARILRHLNFVSRVEPMPVYGIS